MNRYWGRRMPRHPPSINLEGGALEGWAENHSPVQENQRNDTPVSTAQPTPRPHRGDPQGPTREVQYPAGPATNPAPRVDMRTITKTTRRVPKQRRRSRTCRNPSRDPGGWETIAAMEHPTGQRPTREDPTIRPAPTTGGPRCMDNMNHEALQDIGSLYEKETSPNRQDTDEEDIPGLTNKSKEESLDDSWPHDLQL